MSPSSVVRVTALVSIVTSGTGCSLILTEEPPPITPSTTTISCFTTKAPAVVDIILAINSLFGIGYTAYEYDAGHYTGKGLVVATLLGLGITTLFFASANAGINHAESCHEAHRKLELRNLRRSHQPAPDVSTASGPTAPSRPARTGA